MKHLKFFLAFFIFIFLIKIDAQNYGLDNTDPSVFTKYRIPNSELSALWFNTSLNFNSAKLTYNQGNGLTGNYNSNFGYNLTPYYYLLQESDNRYLNLNAQLSGNYSHSYSQNQNLYPPYISTNKQNSYSSNLNASFTYDNYNNGNIFYALSSGIYVNMLDYKYENKDITTSNSYSGNKTQNYIFSFGIGAGKIRNVTPVVLAVRFQERLKQVNIINGTLPEETLEDLAQQFSRQDFYSMVHVRANKYFWQDIEKTLSGDGVSLTGLNMYAANYLMETTNEYRFLRQEGLKAGINIQFNYQNSYVSYAFPQKIEEQLYTLGNAYLNYSHQINLNSQFSFNLSLSGGPNILSNPVLKQQYSLTAGAGYNYELTDRLVVTLNNSFGLTFINSYAQEKILTNNLTFMVNYFVEDDLSFNINYNWQYSDYKNYLPVYPLLNNQNTINAGFTYYISRGLIIN